MKNKKGTLSLTRLIPVFLVFFKLAELLRNVFLT